MEKSRRDDWKVLETWTRIRVASGDPDSSSVLLWTRHTPGTQQVTAEVAEDRFFAKVVATTNAPISATSDWTCRVLVGGLRPSTVYWYRFTDPEGHGSRIDGRSRLLCRACFEHHLRNGVRVHSQTAGTQLECGWRTPSLSGALPNGALESG
jgi:phosphodiesterase/alkaline phosphatase D-like protein